MHIQPAIVAVEQHFIQAFSWMLLHSLWQGLLMAMMAAIVLAFCRRSSSAVRYNLALVHFILFVAACICTFAWEWKKVPLQINLHPLVNLVKANGGLPFKPRVAGLRHFANLCLVTFSANAPLVVLLWLVFFVFRSVRLMGGLLYVYRAKHRYIFQPSEEWVLKIEALCKKLNLAKGVQLLESGFVKMPLVIGSLKPIILVPMGLMAGLPAGQVEAIILHELAHIRRNDYLTNLLQVLTETLFFFNPGLLWISGVLRDERENCCDDIALEQTKNKKEFVQALISFKEYSLYGNNYQVAFPGKKNHLLNRVRRIIGQNNKAFGAIERASFMAGVIILLLIMATAAVTHAGTIRNSIVHSRLISVYTGHQKATSIVATNKSGRRLHVMIHKTNTIHADASVAIEQSARFYDGQKQADSDRVTVRVGKIDEVQQKIQVIETHIVATSGADQVHISQEQARDQEEAKIARAQALKDQAQAKTDQERAARDQEQATRDQEQAKHDQEQAKRDQEQAVRNEEQIKKNREQSARNEEQVKRNQEQVKRNQEQAVRNEEQVKKNQEQAVHNEQQHQQNDLQAIRNREQAERNREQDIRNQMQAKRNRKLVRSSVSVQ
jgi:bla regulator protein BlaR1